jgi:hypothetical protein
LNSDRGDDSDDGSDEDGGGGSDSQLFKKAERLSCNQRTCERQNYLFLHDL